MKGYKIHPGKMALDGILFAIGLGLIVAFFGSGVPALINRTFPARPDSIQSMTSNGIVGCTAFSVNDRDHKWVTAEHCVQSDLGIRHPNARLGGGEFAVVRIDPKVDLALLVSVYSAPSLVLGAKPGVGDEAHAKGFALHSPDPLQFVGHLSNPSYLFPGEDVRRAAFDMQVLQGVSGSPILDRFGNVVSVSQAVVMIHPFGHVTYGATWEALRDFVGADWR